MNPQLSRKEVNQAIEDGYFDKNEFQEYEADIFLEAGERLI